MNSPHHKRYHSTLDFLESHNLINSNISILDCGGGTDFIENFLKPKYPQVSIDSTSSDLRYDLDIPSDTYDFVLCMEVIEHIKDQDSSIIHDIATFTGSGIKNLLKECARVLKKDGSLLITTPNIHSYKVFHNWLHKGDEIFNYRLHPRELGYKYNEEIVKHLFSSYEYSFRNVWNTFDLNIEHIDFYENILKSNRLDTTNRKEDDLFFLCTK